MQTTQETMAPRHTTAVADNAPALYFSPRTDVYETPEALVLVADVPGATEEGIDVTIEGDALTIEAKVTPAARHGFTASHREYDVGSFRRIFTVHMPIDRNAVTAALVDGVLRVTLAKAKEARPQKIQVRSV